MIKAILGIVTVTVAVVAMAVLFGMMARNLVHQDAVIPPHPWFDRPIWHVSVTAPDELCRVPPLADPDVIYLLPVHKTPRRWEVRCANAPAVEEFLAASEHADWMIEIDAGAGEDLDNLVDNVSKVPGKHIGVRARSQRAARALRKKAPNWVFAADDASLLRLRLFSTMRLETVVEFWPDFAIASGDDINVDNLGPREVTELERRRKRVLWDTRNKHEIPPYPVDGLLR